MSGTKKRKVSKSKEKKIILLPKDIRDQLGMTCVIRGYSIIKSGSTATCDIPVGVKIR